MANLIFDDGLSVQVIRTKRKKTLSIRVLNGLVQAVVPEHLTDIRVTELIQKSMPWIRTKLQKESQVSDFLPKKYISGEVFPYLGRNYHLKIIFGDSNKVRLLHGNMEVSVSKDSKESDVRNALSDWYESHALKKLIEKTKQYAGIIGVSPNSISVKNYKSRWGSCSSKGDISYNWRIILAPPHIVNYVVVHELCHLRHMNHSPAYWKSVKQVFPDYLVCRKWLKEKGINLEV